MSQVTVTGVTGPAKTVTATVYQNMTSFAIDTVNEILTVVCSDRTAPVSVEIASAATITVTVSGNNYTVSIS